MAVLEAFGNDYCMEIPDECLSQGQPPASKRQKVDEGTPTWQSRDAGRSMSGGNFRDEGMSTTINNCISYRTLFESVLEKVRPKEIITYFSGTRCITLNPPRMKYFYCISRIYIKKIIYTSLIVRLI